MATDSKAIRLLSSLLQRDVAVLSDIDQLVAPLAVRANEIDAEAVNAGFNPGRRYIGFATDAFPHGDLHRGFLGIVA